MQKNRDQYSSEYGTLFTREFQIGSILVPDFAVFSEKAETKKENI